MLCLSNTAILIAPPLLKLIAPQLILQMAYCTFKCSIVWIYNNTKSLTLLRSAVCRSRCDTTWGETQKWDLLLLQRSQQHLQSRWRSVQGTNRTSLHGNKLLAIPASHTVHCCKDTSFRMTFISVFQVDEGGPQNVLPNSWTTFLKARVMCGKAGTPVQYNNFKQAFVLTSHLRTGLIYGIFSNAW